MSRFDVRTPVGLPQGRPPEPEPAWISLLRSIPLAVLLGILGTVFGWGVRYATVTSASENTVERVARLEASVSERFQRLETSADTRLKEAWARMDQTDRDRDSRTKASNDRVDGVNAALRDKIEELNRKLDQRSEARGTQVNELAGQLSNLQLKVCVLSGLRVSQCK